MDAKHLPIQIFENDLDDVIDWCSIYFTAASDINEKYENAKIVSTKQEYRRLIYDEALEKTIMKYPEWIYVSNKRAEVSLRTTERDMLFFGGASVRESVEINDMGTIIIIADVDDINSDAGTQRALELYGKYEYKKTGTKQEFGKSIIFNTSDFDFNEFTESEYII
jgi:hypothetical protein